MAGSGAMGFDIADAIEAVRGEFENDCMFYLQEELTLCSGCCRVPCIVRREARNVKIVVSL